MAEFQENGVEIIDGVDTEEMLAEILAMYADRKLVLFHRAICQGDLEKVTEDLEQNYDIINQPLLPVACFPEVRKSNGMDYDAFTRFGLVRQVTPYPPVPQFETGEEDEPNELHPAGTIDEPETNLDTVFWSPLMRACYIGNAEMITLLADLGADKNYQSPCRANCITAILHGPFYEKEGLFRLIATAENVRFHDYISDALMNEDLSRVTIIQELLDVGCVVDRNCATFQGDWRSWISGDITAVLTPYLEQPDVYRQESNSKKSSNINEMSIADVAASEEHILSAEEVSLISEQVQKPDSPLVDGLSCADELSSLTDSKTKTLQELLPFAELIAELTLKISAAVRVLRTDERAIINLESSVTGMVISMTRKGALSWSLEEEIENCIILAVEVYEKLKNDRNFEINYNDLTFQFEVNEARQSSIIF